MIILYIDKFFKYLNNKLKIIHNNHMVYLLFLFRLLNMSIHIKYLNFGYHIYRIIYFHLI